jgi:hypothetical protein
MMTTAFYTPTTITQQTIPNEITGIPSIDWNYSAPITPENQATSSKSLYTISGLWMEKFLSNTSQLWCTGLNIPTNAAVAGVEFELGIRRNARIEDLVIQLTYNGELIGDNRASTINPVQSDMYTGDYTTPLNPVGDYSVYGSQTDLWGVDFSTVNVTDPSFGIVVSFRSNQIYPHRDLAYLDQLGIRITYA